MIRRRTSAQALAGRPRRAGFAMSAGGPSRYAGSMGPCGFRRRGLPERVGAAPPVRGPRRESVAMPAPSDVPIAVEEVVPGVYRIAIPIPAPLRDVNAYALRGPGGWTLVDAGFHTPEAEAAWHQAFRQLGIAPRDVEAIVVTHFHPDHLGAAGWLQTLTGAPVYMHEREIDVARRVWQPAALDGYAAFADRHGVPDELGPTLTARRRKVLDWVAPPPRPTPIRPGEALPLGGRRWEVVWAPGHTDGLVVLWQPEEGWLLADDMVLPGISPNISAGPQAAPDPLGRYLESLRRVARLPARLVLPGHRAPFTDLAARCAELEEHHRRRLEAIEAIVDRGGEVTAWQVATELFGRVMDTPANVEFALGETVAHLDYMVRRGRLQATWRERTRTPGTDAIPPAVAAADPGQAPGLSRSAPQRAVIVYRRA
ncbi:MAG: MBL fold metallo-hydrolase [Bacillota bacterium]|nr:MAG: MBL fold metallo-hydrolase [Bacillota bacterium]